MDRICANLFILDGEGDVSVFTGNFTEYLDYLDDKAKFKAKIDKKKSQKTDKTKTNLSYNERKEYNSLEKEIETLEAKLSENEKIFSTESYSSSVYKDALVNHSDTQASLKEKWARWEYLSEFES